MVDTSCVESLRKRLGELERQEALCYRAIQEMRPEFCHSIELADLSAVELGAHLQSNCVMYAFDLRRSALFSAISDGEKIRRQYPSRSKVPDYCIFADTEFLDYCIDNRLISAISGREPESGDLVVYSDTERCHHIGKKILHGRIRSKWGPLEVLEHKLSEVPDFFGNDVQYFESVRHEQSRDFFVAYARSVIENNPETKSILDNIINDYK